MLQDPSLLSLTPSSASYPTLHTGNFTSKPADCYSPPKKTIISFQSNPVDSSKEKIKEAAFLPAQPFKAMQYALIHLCVKKLSGMLRLLSLAVSFHYSRSISSCPTLPSLFSFLCQSTIFMREDRIFFKRIK